MTKILIVDDSATVRMAARAMLKKHPLDILEAVDGQDGLDKTKEHRPDVILLDYNMPNINGEEYLKAVKADASQYGTPTIIFCTTENDITVMARMMELGADDYIMKPFTEEIIAIKLRDTGIIADD